MKDSTLQALNAVLDTTQSSKEAWARLLKTHALTYAHPAAKRLLADPVFAGISPLGDDLLAGLTVGEVGILYEYSLAYLNPVSRKQEGQYFTPDDVAEWLASLTHQFPDGVWLDPCCGVGNLSYWLIQARGDKETFLKQKMRFIDLDSTALLIARTLLTLWFYESDEDLFQRLEQNFIHGDFLSLYVDGSLPEYDFALLNPPYLAGVPKAEGFMTADAKDLYAYFLEAIQNSSSGYVAITPQSFTNASKFKGLREFLLSNAHLKVYAFDNVPDRIFRGFKYGSPNSNTANSTRAGVIVARKEGDTQQHSITPLLRWRAAERGRLLGSVDSFLNPSPSLNAGKFPKVEKELQELYNSLDFENTLKTVLSPTPTAHRLSVPSSPRYFIPAVKATLSRSSIHHIYFESEESLNKYYPYLNSSVLYWWWRVNDGGMTLSLDTLLSLPLPSVELSEAVLLSFIAELEDSEGTKTVKMNAGKANENVKHSPSLLGRLNEAYFPAHASLLLREHNNSCFA